MSFDNWITFTIACIILTAIPGPSVLLIISQALVRGRNAAIMCILGALIGTVALMSLSFMGVGALLATSAVLFQFVKWAGVAYLAYLGFRQIIDARNQPDEMPLQITNSKSLWGSFWAGSITALLNPKAIMFYMAFLAQFIDVNSSFILQASILTMTSLATIAVFLTGYAMLAARARKRFQSQAVRKKIEYAGGGFMLGGSVLMATTR